MKTKIILNKKQYTTQQNLMLFQSEGNNKWQIS